MRIQKRAKALVVAASVAGLVGLGGTAFTATGLTSSVPATQFVGGGSITQTVSGATLSAIAYSFSDATKTAATGADLTFTGTPDTTPVTAVFTADGGATETATCGNVAGNASHCALATPMSLASVTITVG